MLQILIFVYTYYSSCCWYEYENIVFERTHLKNLLFMDFNEFLFFMKKTTNNNKNILMTETILFVADLNKLNFSENNEYGV